MTPASWLSVVAAAFAAGLLNAVAGGGTLISFPVLVALGIPAVSASVTNTVALTAGYLGGAFAQRNDLGEHRRSLLPLVVVGAASGLVGALLLVISPEALFRRVVPYLILFACAVLALQGPIKKRLLGGMPVTAASATAAVAFPPAVYVGLFVAGVYGGYFGAGLGIILLAVLGLVLHGDLIHVNAVKQTLSLVINCVAASFFVFSGRVHWQVAGVMAVASLAGGHLGGRIASRISARALRAVVVVVGLAVAAKYLVG